MSECQSSFNQLFFLYSSQNFLDQWLLLFLKRKVHFMIVSLIPHFALRKCCFHTSRDFQVHVFLADLFGKNIAVFVRTIYGHSESPSQWTMQQYDCAYVTNATPESTENLEISVFYI